MKKRTKGERPAVVPTPDLDAPMNLEIARLRIEFEALETLTIMTLRFVQRTNPEAREALQELVRELRQTLLRKQFEPNDDPKFQTFIEEYNAIWDDLISRVLVEPDLDS